MQVNCMTFNKAAIESDRRTKAQFNELNSIRKFHNIDQKNILGVYGNAMDEVTFQKNSAGILTRDWWREVDNVITEVRDHDQGREFVTDLMGVASPLPIGKTVKLYTNGGDIEGSVERSMDGHTPTVFDYLETETDGDPVPIFSAGVGINWRHWSGLETENVDLLTSSQRRKTVKVMSDIADYFLDGDAKIKEKSYEGQGIRNHRHTKKINLGAGGVNINLVTATNDEIIAFYTKDFAKELDDNYVAFVDKMWVTPALGRRLSEPYSKSGEFKEGTLGDYILRYGRIKEFKVTFKLTGKAGDGNEFFCYVKNKMFISPLVGASVGMVPMARMNPMDNYNFLIWGAMGLQIQGDVNDRGGVFYAADLD